MKHKHKWINIGRPYQKDLYFEWCCFCGTLRMSWTEYAGNGNFKKRYKYRKPKKGRIICGFGA